MCGISCHINKIVSLIILFIIFKMCYVNNVVIKSEGLQFLNRFEYNMLHSNDRPHATFVHATLLHEQKLHSVYPPLQTFRPYTYIVYTS